eukprot:TRINITY_DN5463_c0_g1_i2.p1 TRINITY_DN5463_c0_g1~~TRINITY_DN5463_c0_g1_i2.p1  ORF type:complete len:322 (+),score=109.22 TRINITY_DN5463_c0_g1_i2:782-1747(+)
MCRGKPSPKFEIVLPIFHAVPAFLDSGDHDTCVDALWALSHLTDNEQSIETVSTSGLLPKMIAALSVPDHLLIIPALRALGNIVSGTNEQTQRVLDAGILSPLRSLLSHARKGIQKETCWTLSNIAAGTREQINMIIAADIVPSLVELMGRAPFEVKKEACWVLCNASINGNSEQIKYLVVKDTINELCSFLNCRDNRVILACLEALESILRHGAQLAQASTAEGAINPYGIKVEEADGLDKLEELQSHSNDKIYQKSVSILEEFFMTDEDDFDNMDDDVPETFQPPAAAPTNFQFNFAPQPSPSPTVSSSGAQQFAFPQK